MSIDTRKGASMTTTHHRGAAYTEPLTLFGRPWQGHEVLVPLLAWIITAGVPFVTVLAGGGHGWTFWLIAAGTVLAMTLIGWALGGTRHCQGMVTAWCITTPLTAGGWALLAIGVGPRYIWLYLVWLVLALASVVLFINARKDQHDHEVDHFTGAAEAREREAAEARRRLAVPAQRDQVPFPALDAKKRECLKFEQLLSVAGSGPGPDAATLVRAGLVRPGQAEQLDARRGTDPDSRLTVFERIPTAAGFALWVKLPDDASVSFDQVRQCAPRLEQLLGAKLVDDFPNGSRPGCVRVQRALDKDTGEPITTEIYVYVDVRDVLAKTLRMPERRDDFKPISIYEAFQVGEFTDGTPIMLTLAEIHALIVGRTRMGKSNLLNLLTRQVGRCYDALIWGYDGKGGRWVRPWLKPWRDGMKDPHTGAPLDRPVFDWVAIHLTEFERIVDAGIELAIGRPQLRDSSGSGWTATREKPWVLILADELSEAAGSNGASSEFVDSRVNVTTSSMQEKIARLVRLGAGEGVSLVAAQQRGTVTSGVSGDGKAQIGGRILLPVKQGEASEVLADADYETIRLTMSLKHPGSTVTEGFGLTDAMPGKYWLFGERNEVEQVAARQVIEITHIRPVLDQGSAGLIAKFGYATRWTDPDRIAWLHHRQPANPVMRWKHVLDAQTAAAAGGAAFAGGNTSQVHQAIQEAAGLVDRARAGDAAGSTPLARSRAEQYGLQDIPDPFAPQQPPADAPPPAAYVPEPGPVPDDLDDAAAKWAATEAAYAAEMNWRGKVVEAEHEGTTPPPAPPEVTIAAEQYGPPRPDTDAALMYGQPQQTGASLVGRPLRTVEPTFDNLWPILIEIVAATGSTGATASDVGDELKRRNLNPSSRGTVNTWLDRLDDEHRLVKSSRGRGARYVTPQNWSAAA